MNKLLLVAFSFLIGYGSGEEECQIYKESKKEEIQITASQPIYDTIAVKYDSLYKEVVQSIRDFEDLRLTSYLCPANQKTIGYGHFVRPADNLKDTITLAEAEYLLKKDFDRCISEVYECLGDSVNVNDATILALAHFTYNVGKGNFKNSKLLQMVKNNQPIEDELLKWVYYKDKNNNKIASEYIKRMRQYEVDLIRNVS